MKRLICAVLIVLTIGSCVLCAVGCDQQSAIDNGGAIAPPDDDGETISFPNMVGMLSTELESTEHVLLRAMSPMTVSDGTASQTLQATVRPETATNKAVDWSVSWGDESNTTPVTNYVTVTPASNGSTTATVTCKAPFTGTIIVTVTTRESGFTADCIVSFVGVPTEISTSTSTSMKDATTYSMGIGGTYTFNVTPTNVFGIVGDNYKDVTMTYGATGSLVLCNYSVYNGTGTWTESTQKTVTLDSLKEKFATVSFENGVLTVNTLKSIESYFESSQRIDGGRTTNYFGKFQSYASDCSFYITLRCPSANITKTITFVFDETLVTGVGTDTEMQF